MDSRVKHGNDTFFSGRVFLSSIMDKIPYE